MSPRERSRFHLGRWLLGLVLLSITPCVALLVTEALVANDAQLPHLSKPSDYRPLAITQILSSSGEPIGSIGGAQRLLLPAAEVPDALVQSVVAHTEPRFLERDALGQKELVEALLDEVRGKLRGSRGPVPLSVHLSRSLVDEATGKRERGLLRTLREYIVAMRMERELTRPELVQLYVNQASFGGGGFGAELGALGRFEKRVAKLGPKELDLLGALGTDDPGPVVPEPALRAAVCGSEAARSLASRFPPDVLAHLGARVATSCDLAATKSVEGAIGKRRLDKLGLAATVAVMRLPAHEVVALVGDPAATHALGALRVPFVLGSALASLKWTAASPLPADGPPLRVVTARSPVAAADALVAAGLPRLPIGELAAKAGFEHVNVDQLVDGHAAIRVLDALDLFATLASQGERTQPRLLRSLVRAGSSTPEPLAATSHLQAFTPEVAWLVSSLLGRPVHGSFASAGLTSTDDTGAWAGVYTSDVAVVVWLAPVEGEPGRAAEMGKLAAQLALDVVTLELHGKAAKTFERPARLFVRRIDGKGALVPRGVGGGSEEYFVPGSARREEMELEPNAPEPSPNVE